LQDISHKLRELYINCTLFPADFGKCPSIAVYLLHIEGIMFIYPCG
jgi:hypothetical protein